jgi:hypothetical protein
MPIARIRNYLAAYGIKPKSAIEKDDLIEAIIDARVRLSFRNSIPDCLTDPD